MRILIYMYIFYLPSEKQKHALFIVDKSDQIRFVKCKEGICFTEQTTLLLSMPFVASLLIAVLVSGRIGLPLPLGVCHNTSRPVFYNRTMSLPFRCSQRYEKD